MRLSRVSGFYIFIIFVPANQNYGVMLRHGSLFGLIGTMVAVGAFTSCLEDIGNVYNPGYTPAVVREHGDSTWMMAVTRYGWIYSEDLSSYSEGKCLLVSFDYDPNLPENGNAEGAGYYTVTLRDEVSVSQSRAQSPLTDIGRLLPNEQPIPWAVNPADSMFCVLLDNYLFLPSVCRTTEGRTLEWQLTYDPAQRPEIEDKRTVYSLYLRVAATTGKPEEEEEMPYAYINAFDLSGFIDMVRAGGDREADMYVRLHYVNQINPEDSTRFAWGVTEPLFIK